MGFKRILFFLAVAFCGTFAWAKDSFVTITVGGDTMLANTPTKSLPTVNHLMPLAGIFKSADISFLNYEGTLCDQNVNSHKCRNKAPGELCYAFRGPTDIAQYVAEAGIDVVSLANNHIFDFGHSCATETQTAFEKVGILPIGLMSEAYKRPPETIRFVEHKSKKILFLAFHYSNAWGRVISMNDETTIRNLIRQYRDQAQVIVVSFHAGSEGFELSFSRVPQGPEIFSGESRGDSRKFARIAIEEGADLVVGHGPHVVRGLEMYQDRLIIYSLGNLSTYDLFSLQPSYNVGALIQVELEEDGRLREGLIHSLKQDYIIPGQKRGGVLVKLDQDKSAVKLMQKISPMDFLTPPKILDDGRIYP